MLTYNKIQKAASVLKQVLRPTDMVWAPRLVPGCEQLYLKAENWQVTGSFKVRGAYYKMSLMTDEEKARGVIACSAGNHAQGVALAAQRAGIDATIFIPSIAPISKIEATERYGVRVVIVDGVYDDAYQAAREFEQTNGGVFIHPFDDEQVIAGQGTIGLEILDQYRAKGKILNDLDAIIVPVGGGGLISGVAVAIKKSNRAKNCKVYGVQAAGAASMAQSMATQQRQSLEQVATFADGIAVKHPGELTYNYCSEYVDEIVTVTDDEIAIAILHLMEQQKFIAEGAGAVAVAAAMFNKLPLAGKNVCAIVSGGNIDVNNLPRVINRGLLATGRLSHLTIELIERPGQLMGVSKIIADCGANVVDLVHNPGRENTDIASCILRLTIETKDKAHRDTVIQTLTEHGYKVL
ncbi:MAG: threonine ammonia-lyase [Oscillospiraceae bacterium]|nr:threonine ammonia-lyase [Oscillospiraceae bacterium]